MKSPRLPGVWFYERAITDCLCAIVTAGRKPLFIGEDLYCENHKRLATVTEIAPATLAQQDRLLEMVPASELADRI